PLPIEEDHNELLAVELLEPFAERSEDLAGAGDWLSGETVSGSPFSDDSELPHGSVLSREHYRRDGFAVVARSYVKDEICLLAIDQHRECRAVSVEVPPRRKLRHPEDVVRSASRVLVTFLRRLDERPDCGCHRDRNREAAHHLARARPVRDINEHAILDRLLPRVRKNDLSELLHGKAFLLFCQ